MLLQTENLTVDFGGLVAVNDVNYDLEEGTLAVIIGPNGAGKTTFLNAVSGVVPSTGGKVIFKGENITRLTPPKRIRKGMGKVFQITSIFPQYTVLQNVLVGLVGARKEEGTSFMFSALSKDRFPSVFQTVHEILEKTYLSAERDEVVDNLPLGSKRRLEIAISLSTNPDLFLLDEPMAGLTGEEMENMLNFLKNDLSVGHTIIVIEHRLEAVMRLAERLTVMQGGKVIADGTPAEITTSEAVKKAYLGTYGEQA